jgi:hypothetical protein
MTSDTSNPAQGSGTKHQNDDGTIEFSSTLLEYSGSCLDTYCLGANHRQRACVHLDEGQHHVVTMMLVGTQRLAAGWSCRLSSEWCLSSSHTRDKIPSLSLVFCRTSVILLVRVKRRNCVEIQAWSSRSNRKMASEQAVCAVPKKADELQRVKWTMVRKRNETHTQSCDCISRRQAQESQPQ